VKFHGRKTTNRKRLEHQDGSPFLQPHARLIVIHEDRCAAFSYGGNLFFLSRIPEKLRILLW
jgi:hypothetical protein